MATSFAKASTMFAVLAEKYPITQFSSGRKAGLKKNNFFNDEDQTRSCVTVGSLMRWTSKKRRKVKKIWKWDKLSCVGSFCQIVQRCDCADRRGICHQHFKLSVLQIKFRPEKAKYQAGGWKVGKSRGLMVKQTQYLLFLPTEGQTRNFYFSPTHLAPLGFYLNFNCSPKFCFQRFPFFSLLVFKVLLACGKPCQESLLCRGGKPPAPKAAKAIFFDDLSLLLNILLNIFSTALLAV